MSRDDQPGRAGSSPSRPVKRSITIAGHNTSISLEDAFWGALQDIASGQGTRIVDLIADIDRDRGDASLSGAIRVFVLEHYRRSINDQQDRCAEPEGRSR